MSTIERHIAGTPSWFDLMTPDLDGALKFYGGLFGWTFDVGSPETGRYTMAKVGGRNAAGIGTQPPGASFPSAWSVYFEGNADEIAERVKANGGQIMMEPMDVMDFGRMLVAVDSTGAVFGVWQPKSHTGAQVVDEPGAMAWQEVATRDAAKAVDFYARVFSLEPNKMDAPGITYYTLHKGPKTAGGVMQMNEQWPAEIPPHWMPYFAVENTDAAAAKVEELGGKVEVKPFDSPYGRIAVIADPWGAHFTVIVPSELAKTMG